jgi:integrase
LASGAAMITQHKVGRPVSIQLRQETLQVLAKHVGDSESNRVIWPLWGRREAFYRELRQIVKQAGIRTGTFKWLRRTAATQLERVEPGRGTELLGHQARTTTEAWYIDKSQLAQPPLPPW